VMKIPSLSNAQGSRHQPRLVDLCYDKTQMIKLRTDVLGHDHVKPGPRDGGSFREGAGRPARWFPGQLYDDPHCWPERIQPEVDRQKDPHSAGSEADIRKQTDALLGLYATSIRRRT